MKDSMDLRFNQGGGGGGKGWWVKRKGVGHIVNRLVLYIMVMMITVGCPVCLLICITQWRQSAARVNRQVHRQTKPFRVTNGNYSRTQGGANRQSRVEDLG